MSKVQQQRSQFIMIFFAFSFGMILSNLLGQADDKHEPITTDVIMVYRGLDKTIDDLPESIADEFRALQRETAEKQMQMLYGVALEWQLQEFAQKEQLSIEEAGNKLFQLTPPTEKEVNAFYLARAEQIAKPFYEVKTQIQKHLMHQKALNARSRKIAELLEKGDLALFLD